MFESRRPDLRNCLNAKKLSALVVQVVFRVNFGLQSTLQSSNWNLRYCIELMGAEHCKKKAPSGGHRSRLQADLSVHFLVISFTGLGEFDVVGFALVPEVQ